MDSQMHATLPVCECTRKCTIFTPYMLPGGLDRRGAIVGRCTPMIATSSLGVDPAIHPDGGLGWRAAQALAAARVGWEVYGFRGLDFCRPRCERSEQADSITRVASFLRRSGSAGREA